MVAPNSNKHRKWLTKVILICLAVILVLLLSTQVQARSLTAKLDRQQAEMGDILNLIVQTDFQTFDAPDFSVLQDQFDVLGSQQSSQIQIVNGDYQAFSRWDIRITPKQLGELQIPPLTVSGVNSAPVKLTVTKDANPGGKNRGSHFFESSVNLTEPYVQQEVIYTLRFYHLGNLVRGNIRPPVFKDAITQNLRQQYNYQKQIDGRLYEVYEWTWAFYPQKSGEMVIAKQSFDGRIQLGTRMKQVRDQTKTLSLQVKPKPTTFPNNATWLPAEKLQLTEEWQAPNTLRVGDSITRTFNLQAKGLQASQLPSFEMSAQSGYNSYPDQAKTRNHPQTDSQMTVIGQLQQKIAIVPTEAGTITLPEIQLPWWNTVTNRQEVAVLPAKQFTVLPAVQTASAPTEAELENLAEAPRETIAPQIDNVPMTTYYWLLLVGLLSFGWLFTLIAYWRLKQQPQPATQPQEDKPSNTPDTPVTNPACTETEGQLEAKPVYQAWLAFAQSQPEQSLPTELETLQAHLFGDQTLSPENEQQLLTQLCQRLQHQHQPSATTKQDSALEPIYPR